MIKKEINLQGYKDKGVTLYVSFAGAAQTDPFTILITDPTGKMAYYQRMINKNRVTINLPVHSDIVVLHVLADHQVNNVVVSPIKITKIKYSPRQDIIQKRNYDISEIKDMVLPVIRIPILDPQGKPIRLPNGQMITAPTDQPARFIPSVKVPIVRNNQLQGVKEFGIRQFADSIIKNWPQPSREFAADHEEGHYYFGRKQPAPYELKRMNRDQIEQYQHQLLEDEEGADDYALHKMINKGYNLSGTLFSLTNFLPDTYISKERIKRLYDTAQKINPQLVA